MVISCSPKASIMRAMALLAVASALSRRFRCRATGSAVRSVSRHLSI
jgi:hypothetical protein